MALASYGAVVQEGVHHSTMVREVCGVEVVGHGKVGLGVWCLVKHCGFTDTDEKEDGMAIRVVCVHDCVCGLEMLLSVVVVGRGGVRVLSNTNSET